MDDILVFRDSYEQHNEHLEAVLRCLEENGVTHNIEKCEFAKKKVEFLGHVISKDGIEAQPLMVEAIKQMKAPFDVSKLRRILGMVNQMGKYVPNLAQTSKPLRDLLTKDSAWIWKTAQKKAFKKIKRQLISTPVLAIYDPKWRRKFQQTPRPMELEQYWSKTSQRVTGNQWRSSREP